MTDSSQKAVPIYCNIFLMMLSMFLFVWLVKPAKKQLGMLTILYVTFTPLTRYMLSGMPECVCFAMVISGDSDAHSHLSGAHAWGCR